jgi:hypothetical protein
MKEKILVLYAFHEYNIRVINFINNAIFKDDNIDFVLISNDRNINFTCPEYVIKVYRDNIGFDFGSWSDVLLHDNFYQNYDYFIFSNSSIGGPYLKNNNDKWTNKFIEPLNNKFHMFGSFMNMRPRPHIQTYIYSMKKWILEYFITNGIFDNTKYEITLKQAVYNKEVRMGQLITSKKWKLGSLLPGCNKPQYIKHNKNDLHKYVFIKARINHVDLYNMAFGDPCPNKSKKFYIKYKNVNYRILNMSLNEDQQNKLDSPQQIIKATYGNIDVTNKCNLPLNNNNELKYINNLNINIPYIYFLNDPFPNNFKTLVIEYIDIYNNISKQFYRENTNIDLNYNKIIKCTYGYKSYWKDVTQIILKFDVKDYNKIDNLIIVKLNIDYNDLFGDPCFGENKFLFIKYENINGKIYDIRYQENLNHTLYAKQLINAEYGTIKNKINVKKVLIDYINKNYKIKNINTENDKIKNTNTENDKIKNTNTENDKIKNTNTENDKIKNTNIENDKIKNIIIKNKEYNDLFGDPCFGISKKLVIEYINTNNNNKISIFNENKFINIKYKKIIKAIYGNDTKTINVKNKLINNINNDYEIK